MALSAAFIDAHIAEQTARLTSPIYSYRKHWPARLFHHAPLENAVDILKAGVLRSRNDPDNTHPRDVAAPGVIDAREYAKDYVRLYFRPKTPTQWNIEGIRKPGECAYGDESQAPVLVMFALDAKEVLSRPDVMFSDRNMQLADTVPGRDEAYFRQIPFNKVFSEGGIGGDRSIIGARCAEVLTSSPLDLTTCLREIYFRSEPERDTVLEMVGRRRREWNARCHVSDALKVFQKDYTFVQEISLTPEGVVFRFNHRADRKNIDVSIKAWDALGRKVLDFHNHDLAPQPPSAENWIWRCPLKPGDYLVRVKLDGHTAYEAHIPLENVLF